MTVLTFSNDMAPVPESIPAKAAAQPLLDLPKHTIAYVEEVIANPAFGLQDNLVSRRLHDLGFLPNTAIKISASPCLVNDRKKPMIPGIIIAK